VSPHVGTVRLGLVSVGSVGTKLAEKKQVAEVDSVKCRTLGFELAPCAVIGDRSR
jgi:hypothetical protein